MLLPLPSGFVATVCSPTLRAVLDGASLAEASLATPGLGADALTEDDVFALSQWAADELAADPEAAAFAEVCAAFCCRPSTELGIKDGILAFAVDNRLLGALRQARETEADADASRERVRFTTGGPQ